jgi:hypothetical protein
MTVHNVSELKRNIFRDIAAKRHMAQCMTRVSRSFACDALETETAEDYCKRMLEKLGLKAAADPIMALTYFLEGHDSSARKASMESDRKAAMDSGSSTGSALIDKMLGITK